MNMRISAVLAAAVLFMLQVGCGNGAVPPGHVDSLPDDNSYLEIVESEETEIPADSEIAEIIPSDTESIPASEEFRSFLNWEEDTSEGKVYNIFCSDEEFMNLVARYCEGYTVPDQEEEPDSRSTSDESSEESSESPDGEEHISADVYKAEIDGAEVRWIICHDVGERYLINLDLSLDTEKDPNEVTDLFIVGAADVQKYVDPEVRVAMPLIRDAGLPTSDFDAQYAYIKVMGSGDDGVQRAVSYEVSPGVFMYNRQAAVSVLGSDDPAVVQEAVSDWEKFDRLAADAHEKGYAMLADWTDAFDAHAALVAGDWLTKTGGVKIDNALRRWSDQSELYIEKGYFAAGDQPVFGTFVTAKEIIDLAAEADEEEMGGKYGICAGPCGWFRDGNYIVISAECDQRSLTKKILEEVVFDPDVLREMKTGGIIPNNRIVLPEKISDRKEIGNREEIEAGEGTGEREENSDRSEIGSGNEINGSDESSGPDKSDTEIPEETDSSISAADEETAMPRITDTVSKFLGGQDPYPVFGEAAGNVVLGDVSVFDWYLCDVYRREFSLCFSGEKDREEAMKVFYREVSDFISEEE